MFKATEAQAGSNGGGLQPNFDLDGCIREEWIQLWAHQPALWVWFGHHRGTTALAKTTPTKRPRLAWISLPCTRLSSLQNLIERDEEAWSRFCEGLMKWRSHWSLSLRPMTLDGNGRLVLWLDGALMQSNVWRRWHSDMAELFTWCRFMDANIGFPGWAFPWRRDGWSWRLPKSPTCGSTKDALATMNMLNAEVMLPRPHPTTLRSFAKASSMPSSTNGRSKIDRWSTSPRSTFSMWSRSSWWIWRPTSLSRRSWPYLITD